MSKQLNSMDEVYARASTMEAEVIRSLLSGNDTQCFSTQQYAERRDAWIATNCTGGATRADVGLPPCEPESVRRQIIGSGFVVEVAPDVWMLKEHGSAT